MIRSATGADDLEAYIDEEIVISSETQSSDIYTDNASVSSTQGAKGQPICRRPDGHRLLQARRRFHCRVRSRCGRGNRYSRPG